MLFLFYRTLFNQEFNVSNTFSKKLFDIHQSYLLYSVYMYLFIQNFSQHIRILVTICMLTKILNRIQFTQVHTFSADSSAL